MTDIWTNTLLIENEELRIENSKQSLIIDELREAVIGANQRIRELEVLAGGNIISATDLTGGAARLKRDGQVS